MSGALEREHCSPRPLEQVFDRRSPGGGPAWRGEAQASEAAELARIAQPVPVRCGASNGTVRQRCSADPGRPGAVSGSNGGGPARWAYRNGSMQRYCGGDAVDANGIYSAIHFSISISISISMYSASASASQSQSQSHQARSKSTPRSFQVPQGPRPKAYVPRPKAVQGCPGTFCPETMDSLRYSVIL